MEWILNLDKNWFLFLNRFHSDYLDTMMLMVTRKEFWIPLYILILIYIFRTCERKSFLVIFILILAVVVSDQLTGLIKEAVQRLRPVHDPSIQGMVHNVLHKGGLYGFPSSHASNSFAIFIFTALLFRNRSYSVILLSWALLVSYSRIYAGVHFPFDVVVGIVIGLLAGGLSFRLFLLTDTYFFASHAPKPSKIRLKDSQAGITLLILMVHFSSLMISAWILHKYNYL